MLAATQLTADGVLDVQEADAQRAQAKTKLDKVRCSGVCERARARVNITWDRRLAHSRCGETERE